jgi:multisubunit Na+/H+ antiporter MnhG subunit
MTMKALIAVAFVTLSLLSAAVSARAEAYAPYYDGYPSWARHAFDSQS